MKKNIILVALLIAVVGGAFAQNHHFGVDISASFNVGFWEGVGKNDDKNYETVLFQPNFRISSYNGIWLNHMLGVYALVGTGGNLEFDKEMAGTVDPNTKVDVGIASDFAVGPCFGIDLGSIRFNVGVGFHLNVSTLVGKLTVDGFETNEDSSAMLWLGVAISPQFRLTANRRCSFVFGCDFFFDGYVFGGSENISTNKFTELKLKDTVRFSCAPYIGFGINFGS